MTYQTIIDQLLQQTRASRATLRLEQTDSFFPVVAESCAQGVRPISDDTSIDLRKAPTYKWLDAQKKMLIQEDLRDADPAPPAELIEHYGARAQMLAPVVIGDKLVGVISVHESSGPRKWTQSDVAALEEAMAHVHDLLAAA